MRRRTFLKSAAATAGTLALGLVGCGGSPAPGQPSQGQDEGQEPEPQKIRALDLELKDAFTILEGSSRMCVVTVGVTNNSASTLTLDPNDYWGYEFANLVGMRVTGEELKVQNFIIYNARPDYEQSTSIAPGEVGTLQFAAMYRDSSGYLGAPGDPLDLTMSTPIINEGDEMPDTTTLTDDIELETVIDESLEFAEMDSHEPNSPYRVGFGVNEMESYVVGDDGSPLLFLYLNFTNDTDGSMIPEDAFRVTCEQDGVELERVDETIHPYQDDGAFDDAVRPGREFGCWLGYAVTSPRGHVTACVYDVNDDTWPLASLDEELDPDEW